jgi:hypothetical protein
LPSTGWYAGRADEAPAVISAAKVHEIEHYSRKRPRTGGHSKLNEFLNEIGRMFIDGPLER